MGDFSVGNLTFDFERSVMFGDIRSSSDLEDYYVILDYAGDPTLVPKNNVYCFIVPELGNRTGSVLVDIRGHGSRTHAVIAADDERKIISLFESRGLAYP